MVDFACRYQLSLLAGPPLSPRAHITLYCQHSRYACDAYTPGFDFHLVEVVILLKDLLALDALQLWLFEISRLLSHKPAGCTQDKPNIQLQHSISCRNAKLVSRDYDRGWSTQIRQEDSRRQSTQGLPLADPAEGVTFKMQKTIQRACCRLQQRTRKTPLALPR
jgi:hypothetical protein